MHGTASPARRAGDEDFDVCADMLENAPDVPPPNAELGPDAANAEVFCPRAASLSAPPNAEPVIELFELMPPPSPPPPNASTFELPPWAPPPPPNGSGATLLKLMPLSRSVKACRVREYFDEALPFAISRCRCHSHSNTRTSRSLHSLLRGRTGSSCMAGGGLVGHESKPGCPRGLLHSSLTSTADAESRRVHHQAHSRMRALKGRHALWAACAHLADLSTRTPL